MILRDLRRRSGKVGGLARDNYALWFSMYYLSAQTAFYSLNLDHAILEPLAINHAYIRLAQASGQSYHSSGHRL